MTEQVIDLGISNVSARERRTSGTPWLQTMAIAMCQAYKDIERRKAQLIYFESRSAFCGNPPSRDMGCVVHGI